MLLNFLVLISLGFVIGLSGAIIPGPLLAFTVFDTSRKRSITGHFIIFGHVVWELIIILKKFYCMIIRQEVLFLLL